MKSTETYREHKDTITHLVARDDEAQEIVE